MPRFLPLLLLVSLLGLTGCITSAPSRPAAAQVAPIGNATSTPGAATQAARPPAIAAAVVELPPASIRGSEETSTLLDNFTVYLTAVDGVPLSGGREAWDQPVSLKAGPRRVTVTFVRGVFTANAEVDFTAESQASYQVKFASDAEFLGKNTYCEFWIVNLATGESACAKVRAPLTRLAGVK